MKSINGSQVEHVETQHVSLIGRAVSWVILKLLGLTLVTIAAGIVFATFKYLVPDDPVPLPPMPYSPAAVAASPAPPIDYHQHPPPAGLTDNVPLPAPTYAPPPLPRPAPHRPAGHPPQRQRSLTPSAPAAG